MTNPTHGTDVFYALINEARSYPDAIVLGRGDPDFGTPQHVIAAAREAMREHAGDNIPPEGILPLREAIAARVKNVNGVEVDPETEIVVTNGGQEALFLMVLTVIDEGDALLVPEPNYNTYDDAIRFSRGLKVGVPTRLEDDFRADPDQIRQALTEHARALLLVSPGNPTARVIAPDDVRALVEIARENDLMILEDDTYDLFIYDDYVHLSPAALPSGKERTLALNTVSKSFAMTGWRIGWVIGPADLITEVKQLKASITGHTSVISQYAALAALTGPQSSVIEMRDALARRRRLVMDALESMGIGFGMPQGGQFLFADIGFTGMTSAELAQRILTEQHVMVVPGSAYGTKWDSYIRITFLQPEDKLREALDRIRRMMGQIS
jgi:aminotransferase